MLHSRFPLTAFQSTRPQSHVGGGHWIFEWDWAPERLNPTWWMRHTAAGDLSKVTESKVTVPGCTLRSPLLSLVPPGSTAWGIV